MRRTLVAIAMWACGVLLVAAIPSSRAQDGLPAFEPEGKDAKHLTFTATVAPFDPFADMNNTNPPPQAKMQARRGETVLVTIHGVPEMGWHTYPLTTTSKLQSTEVLSKLTFLKNDHAVPLYPVKESPPKLGKDDQYEHDEPFTWTQEIYIKPDAPPGKPLALAFKIRAQVCKKTCIWDNYQVSVSIPVSTDSPVPPSEELKKRLGEAPPKPAPTPQTKTEGSGGDDKATTSAGWWGPIGLAIGGGFISLLTPCVFPMIPITVSYFLKQSETTSRKNTILMAAVYSGTLVLVLTLGGMLLLRLLIAISTHWITNLAIGGIFTVFALSLLGMYDITLPSWLQDFTAAKEGKGGLVGVFFMALTFSIISFACVGPIYGAFITFNAADPSGTALLQKFLAVFAFSAAFASPFFLLALFPSLLRSVPRAGSWMNSIKVVMGFLELAAVFKFLRAAELVLRGEAYILTFDFTLGIWVAICLACGLYLLGVYRLPHDHDAPESIGVPRLLFSVAFISLALYLTPGLFKGEDGDNQRPRGKVFAWVESFLLPDDPPASKGKGDQKQQLKWYTNLEEALAEAEKQKKLVFVDFTGKTCTNCKLNEKDVFTRADVKEAFGKHILLKLYTDYLPAGVDQRPDARGADTLLVERFNTRALPLYALLRPKGKEFEIVWKDKQGLIEDVPKFIQEISR